MLSTNADVTPECSVKLAQLAVGPHNSPLQTTRFRQQHHQGTHNTLSLSSVKMCVSTEHNRTQAQKRQNSDYLAGYFQFGGAQTRLFKNKALYSSLLRSPLGCTCSQDSQLTHYFLHVTSHFSPLLQKLLNLLLILLWMQLQAALLRVLPMQPRGGKRAVTGRQERSKDRPGSSH